MNMLSFILEAVLLLVFILSGISTDDSLPHKDSQLYCIYDNFESDCPHSQVVMFQSAILHLSVEECKSGKEFDPNSTVGNCSLDITSDMERLCLGKWSCTVELREYGMRLKDKLDCVGFEENNIIISLSYNCVSVEKSACFSCENSEYAKLTQSKGYLGSIVTLDSRISSQCGNSRCPWYLQVPPGQVVNLTMVDSEKHVMSNHQGAGGRHSSLISDSSSCHKKYVTVKERANPKDFYYCGGRGRVSHLYLSVSNTIEIHINDDQLSNVGGQFLIYYEVIGCADIIPPRFSRMKRNGDNCEIDCPETDLKWTLVCKGQTWEGLEALGTCPPAPGLLEAEPQKSNVGRGASIFSSTLFEMPMGVVMALVIACAVILGVLILTTGLVCLKRNQYDSKHRDDPNIYGAACSEFEFREMGAGPLHPALLAKTAPYMNTGAFAANRSRRASADLLMGSQRDNTYAMQEMAKMDTRPLPSLPPQCASQVQGNSWCRNDGPVPYGVVRFYPPGISQPNRVTVQLHRTDTGTEYPGGANYRARCPPPGGQFLTRLAGPTGSRFDQKNTAPRRLPGPLGSGGAYDSQEENHYFVLDGNACAEETEPMELVDNQQTMMMTMSAMPFPQPPPAHQNRPPVTTMPRPMPPSNNSMVMMATHRHQHSFGGSDLRCTCDDALRFPLPNPDSSYAQNHFVDVKGKNISTADIAKSSGSINNQI